MSELPAISIHYFIGSFALGILIVYLLAPAPDVVVRFPTPHNAGKVTYEDRVGTCYQYSATEVACDNKTEGPVMPQPIVEDFNREVTAYDEDEDRLAEFILD